jgi:hypothetical protein
MPNHEPTIASILRTLAAQYDGPVAERLVLERVLEQRPSNAKNPYATIRERLRWDGPALGWLRLDRSQLVPMHVVLQGLRFRCLPDLWELETGVLPLVRLQPFAGLRGAAPQMQDEAGALLPGVSAITAPSGRFLDRYASAPAFDLSAWYARNHFTSGDSVLVTIVNTEPVTLQIAYEPAADFRSAEVGAQDAELAAAIFERVHHSQLPLILCDELILPIFARASWRTHYPGHPWQVLVDRDPRLQLVEETFIALQRNVPFYDGSDAADLQREAEENQLLRQIEELQQELRQSRLQDADNEIWTGQIQRASAASSLLDRRTGQDFMSRSDQLRRLEEYDDYPDFPGWEDWEDSDWEDDLFETDSGLDLDDMLAYDLNLKAASQRLFAALPPDAAERLQYARPEEAEVIIAAHLNDLLVREPSLFAKIDLSSPSIEPDKDSDTLFSETIFEHLLGSDLVNWDDEWADDDDDDSDLLLDVTSNTYTYSSELMSQFYNYLIETGRSASTARVRSRNLWVYADFLASYYGRTLAEGDYATLDECLFFFYPRRILNGSARQIREICTSLKQFYSFLVERGDINDDRFAHALWRRRDQAVQVFELYNRLSSDSPNFEKLSSRLFAPYSL